ncbi:MAG: hypothetical protein ACK5MD_10850 [Flavobacteriales bacterium]
MESGWVVLIVATILSIAYLVYKNWDEIVAFVEWVGDGIADAVGWLSETVSSIWDATTPTTIPIDVPITPPITIPVERTEPISVSIPQDRTIPRNRGPYNVYDVHVNILGQYGDYTRGVELPTMIFLDTGKIYKYGITMYGSVLKRYEAFSWTSDKEAMILENLKFGRFGALEWYAFRVNKVLASFVEIELISAYGAIHRKYPPGNTGLY